MSSELPIFGALISSPCSKYFDVLFFIENKDKLYVAPTLQNYFYCYITASLIPRCVLCYVCEHMVSKNVQCCYIRLKNYIINAYIVCEFWTR